MGYLSEKRKSLPEGCLYDKGKIGCGGTSLALECEDPYVVCVPFISLIDNKISQYPNNRRKEEILAVTKDTGKMKIKYYDRSATCPKILVTYDSLWKVVECIDPCKYRLLVDEYHLLFNQYSFRSQAVNIVLEHYKKFKSFTFMTATPLEDEFILDELKDLKLVKEEWDDVLDVQVKTVKCSNVLASTIKLINLFLSGDFIGNAYLFVNSLDFIKEIYKRLPALDETNSKIIYSKSNKTEMPISRSDVSSPIRKINFLTSTVFEGADIYDPEGRIIVISDPSKANTLLDISTSIQQIAGRIRNSKYINQIMHLYNTTRYSDISYEDFKELNLRNIDESEKTVMYLNALPEVARKKILQFSSDTYIQKLKDETFFYDANMAKVDLYNFKVAKGMYTCRINLEAEYAKCDVKTQSLKDDTKLIDTITEPESFKDIVLKLREGQPFLQAYKDRYPFLEEAIKTLGFEKLNSLKYVQRDIKNELLIKSDKSLDDKVFIRLYKKLELGKFYTPGELKEVFTKVYAELNIPEVAKSSHIQKYFNYTQSAKKMNGSSIKGVILTGYTHKK